MRIDRTWMVYAAANILLFALADMINDGVAGWSVSVFLAGPCVVWPALRLGTFELMLCLAVGGLAADAALPTPPGFMMSLQIAGAIFILALRPWLGRIQRRHQLGLAWLLNAAFFAAFTIWALARNHAGGAAFWERALVDFCLSQIIVLPITLWFFDFQESALALAGWTAAAAPAGEAS